MKSRLRWLWSRLPLAAEAADEDLEHVHQLRVACRRATAAMETFTAYLPPRRAAWFDRKLKRIRARPAKRADLDVLALRLQKEFQGDTSDAAAAIVARVSAARNAAQTRDIGRFSSLAVARIPATDPQAGSSRAIARSARRDFMRRFLLRFRRSRCGGLRRRLSRNCEPSIFKAARRQMRQLVDAWFIAAEADLSDTHRLHLFRIAGKRLRYGMEIFASALGSNCRKELYPQVEQILEQLGQINDHVSSEARFQAWLDETEARINERC